MPYVFDRVLYCQTTVAATRIFMGVKFLVLYFLEPHIS
jgi:hypothetical protein